MSDSFSIGIISPEDWEQYKRLRLEALQSDPSAFPTKYDEELESPDEKWQSRLSKATQGNGALIVFAKDQEDLIGMAGSFWLEDDTANIVSVYVNRNHRGKGIGTKLMEDLLNKIEGLSKFKKLKLEVNSIQQSAVGLYEKMGFKKIGSERMTLGDGNEYEVIAMEKEL